MDRWGFSTREEGERKREGKQRRKREERRIKEKGKEKREKEKGKREKEVVVEKERGLASGYIYILYVVTIYVCIFVGVRLWYCRERTREG
jgi:hypothetical protein